MIFVSALHVLCESPDQAKGCVVKVGLGQMSFPSSFGKSAAVSAKLGSQDAA